ncbi:unnamed protein product [Echinostoma caproni]|uniref:Protein kinase domain-containing protein n=1 Tax=Echinostoma caproni TaxID=27848 RepID=A0A182ZZ97_9TREM|nr:unnamed protein product [Echinostoma caproni]
MCWHRIFGCTVCSGKQNCIIRNQLVQCRPTELTYLEKSEEETVPTSGSGIVPPAVSPRNRISPIHCSVSEEKSNRKNTGVALLFCPMEEEVPNYSHSGDYESFHQSFGGPKEAMPVELLNDGVVCKHTDQTTGANSRPSTEINCLLTFNDNPGHQLASMNQVGDFPSQCDSCGSLLTPDSYNSGRHTHVAPSIPDVSSTIVPGDQPAPTSTTAGIRWTVYEQDNGYAGTFEENERFRPPVPTRFSLQLSSEGYPPLYRSESFYGEDARAGYTSTTHEIRWTQVEQEPTQSSDKYQSLTLPLPVCLNIIPPKWVEPHCCSLQPNSYDNSQTESAIPTFPDPFRMMDGKCLHTQELQPERIPDPFSLTSPIRSPTERTSTLNDPYVLLVTDEAPYATQTLNEFTWHGEHSNQVTLRHSSMLVDPVGYPRQGSTSMLVQYSPIHLPASICPASPSSSLSEYKFRCGRCEALAVQRQMIKHKYTQTTKKSPTNITCLPNVTLNFVLISPPIGSEPPPVSLRWGLAHEFREISWNSHISRHSFDQPMKKDAKLKLCASVFDSDLKRTALIGSERLAPLRIRQPPLPQPVKFVPFERLRPPVSSTNSKPMKGMKVAEISRIDVNELEEISLNNLSTGNSGESRSVSGARGVLNCTYVEVLIRRNLDCVASPACLNNSESRMIFNLLDRKLQSAIAMQFLACIDKTRKKALLNNESMGSCIPEGGDSEVVINRKAILTDEVPDSGIPGKLVDPQKTIQLPKCHSTLGICRKRACSGAYVFTQGPRHVKPPRQWMDHVRPEATCSEFQKVAAWKLEPSGIVLGGLINHDYHLQIVVSSNDGRLGAIFLQADALMSEMCKKGAMYTRKKCRIFDPRNQRENGLFGDSIRMFFRCPEIARLLSCDVEDMSVALGLEELGLSVFAVPKKNTFSGRQKWENVVMFTRDGRSSNGRNRLRQVVAGVKQLRMVAMELAKSRSNSNKRDIQPVEGVEYLFQRTMSSPKQLLNYTKLYLTKGMIEKLKDRSTIYEGSLAHCIRTTAYCPTYLYPRASDPDAYQLYGCLFDPILKAINCKSRSKLQQTPDYQLPGSLHAKLILPNVISYRVRFVRNVAGYGFPAVMSLNDYLMIEKMCKEVLLQWTEEGPGTWYPLADFQEQHPGLYSSLLKKNLLVPRKSAARKVSGVCRFWPEGRAIYIAPNICRDCDLVVQINGDDHLKVICVDWTGKQPNLAYARASKLMHWLDTRICFSRNSRWGFLSPVPENVGTGMQFSALVKFPNATKDPELFDRVCTKFQLQVRTNCSKGLSVLHNVFEIALQSTFGRTEAELAVNFLQGLTRICHLYVKQSA